MPASTKLEIGDPCGPSVIKQNAFVAGFAIFFVRIWLSKKPKTGTLRLTFIIARDAEFALRNALPDV